MKTLYALFIIAAVSGSFADVIPAIAADLPDNRVPVYVPPPRVYVVPGCRLGTERWWDGYGWHVRSIQICY